MASWLKPSGLPDLALIVSETEAIAAGVFTTSQSAGCLRRLLPSTPPNQSQRQGDFV
jgi:hypothetical protein